MKYLMFIIVVISYGCAINPKTGEIGIPLGAEMAWDLELRFTHKSEDVSGELLGVLTGLGYSISLISRDPFLLNTEIVEIGDPIRGLQEYRINITSENKSTIVVRINPEYDIGGGITRRHFNQIFDPLKASLENKGFIELGYLLNQN